MPETYQYTVPGFDPNRKKPPKDFEQFPSDILPEKERPEEDPMFARETGRFFSQTEGLPKQDGVRKYTNDPALKDDPNYTYVAEAQTPPKEEQAEPDMAELDLDEFREVARSQVQEATGIDPLADPYELMESSPHLSVDASRKEKNEEYRLQKAMVARAKEQYDEVMKQAREKRDDAIKRKEKKRVERRADIKAAMGKLPSLVEKELESIHVTEDYTGKKKGLVPPQDLTNVLVKSEKLVREQGMSAAQAVKQVANEYMTEKVKAQTVTDALNAIPKMKKEWAGLGDDAKDIQVVKAVVQDAIDQGISLPDIRKRLLEQGWDDLNTAKVLPQEAPAGADVSRETPEAGAPDQAAGELDTPQKILAAYRAKPPQISKEEAKRLLAPFLAKKQ